MEIKIPEERKIEDIFLWILEMAEKRWQNACVQVTDGRRGEQIVTKGLETSMYARLYDFDYINELKLECSNGDYIFYSLYKPDILQIGGLPGFLSQFPIEIPKYSLEQWSILDTFALKPARSFLNQSINAQLRMLMHIATITKGSFALSSKNTNGKLIPIVSSSTIEGYSDILVAIIKIPAQGWILWHPNTAVLYTGGIGSLFFYDLSPCIISIDEE